MFGMHAVTYPCMRACADAGVYAPRHRTHETWSSEKWEWGSEGKHVARRRLSRTQVDTSTVRLFVRCCFNTPNLPLTFRHY